jgi:DNA-binding transcriptional LysR family regulator
MLVASRFTLRQIEYFIAVGELGSISLASERLNISPPSISTAVSDLEAALGLELFIRHHAQGVSLTSEGRRLLQEAKALLARANALHEVAGEMLTDLRGRISLGCLVVLAALVWPTLRQVFQERYPEVETLCSAEDQTTLFEKLRNSQIDLAITYDLGIPSDINFEPLARLSPHALLSSNHPLAAKEKVALDELIEDDFILLDQPLSRDYFLGVFRDAGLKPKVRERIADYSLVRALIARGFGYGIGNIRPINAFSQDGSTINLVPLAGKHRPMVLGLATTRVGPRPRVLQAFEDHCRALIRDDSIPGMKL